MRHCSNNDPGANNNSWDGEENEDIQDGRIGVPDPFPGRAGEEGEADEEYDHGELVAELRSPLLERVELALTVSAAFNQRPALTPQVARQAPFCPYRDHCGVHAEQGA